MRMKEQSQKAGLKLNIQKTKIMASGPITSWQKLGLETCPNHQLDALTEDLFATQFSLLCIKNDYSVYLKGVL